MGGLEEWGEPRRVGVGSPDPWPQPHLGVGVMGVVVLAFLAGKPGVGGEKKGRLLERRMMMMMMVMRMMREGIVRPRS